MAKFCLISPNLLKTEFDSTVKLVCNDHTWDPKKWPLFTGGRCSELGVNSCLTVYLNWFVYQSLLINNVTQKQRVRYDFVISA